MDVCITGGAGFIGSHLADAFVAAGHRVLVVDDLSSGRRENLPRGPSSTSSTSRSARRPSWSRRGATLVHHAAQMDVRRSVDDPAFDAEVNVARRPEPPRGGPPRAGAAGRLRLDRRRRLRRAGGLPGPRGAPGAAACRPTAVSKLAFEHYLHDYHLTHGLDAACLRYANVYGERQSPHGEAGVVAIFLDRLLSGRPATINGAGLQTRDYIHVSDVVGANLAVVGPPGFLVYNVGTGVETSVVDLYRELARAVGSELEPVARTGQIGRAAALGGRRDPHPPRPRPPRAPAAGRGPRPHRRLVPPAAGRGAGPRRRRRGVITGTLTDKGKPGASRGRKAAGLDFHPPRRPRLPKGGRVTVP